MEDNSPELEIVNVELSFESDAAKNTHVLADREQLRRVINNLIGNAVKYRGDKEKGIIRISLKEEEGFVQVSVEDNGKGINASALPYIFERFYRADTSRNSKQGGSGLGLAIAKRIIEEHGGRIWAESVEGEGTTVRFTLKKVDVSDKKGTESYGEYINY